MTPNQVPYFLSLARPGRFSSAEAIMNALPQHLQHLVPDLTSEQLLDRCVGLDRC